MPNGRIVNPVAPQIGCLTQDGPSAFPVTLQLMGPTGPQAIAFGGLTKLELGALLIYGAFAANPENGREATDAEDIELAVQLSKEILDECARVQKAGAGADHAESR